MAIELAALLVGDGKPANMELVGFLEKEIDSLLRGRTVRHGGFEDFELGYLLKPTKWSRDSLTEADTKELVGRYIDAGWDAWASTGRDATYLRLEVPDR